MKKAGKEVSSFTGSAIKKAFSTVISEIAGEIIKETGVVDIAREKIISTGFKVVKDMNMDISSMKKDMLKNAILKELKI